MFSKACEYGIRASIYLTGESELGRKVSLKEVAHAIDSPEAYTSKILQALNKSDLVISEKGPNGGFSIDQRRIRKLSLLEVVQALDGDRIFSGCGLGLKKCNAHEPCPMHDQFTVFRGELCKMLEGSLISELSKEIKDGRSFLKLSEQD